jgi:hypothetical protein
MWDNLLNNGANSLIKPPSEETYANKVLSTAVVTDMKTGPKETQQKLFNICVCCGAAEKYHLPLHLRRRQKM